MSTPRRSGRGPGRFWRGVAAVVVVLAVLAVVIDRVAVRIAEDQAASRFQSREHLSHKPTVTIRGFPFLNQVVAGHFDDVTLTAADLVLVGDGRSVTITTLYARLRGLTLSRDLSSATAESGTGRAVISYPSLSRATGATVEWAGRTADSQGRVRARKTVTVLGQDFTGSVSAEVGVSGRNVVEFASPTMNFGGVVVPQIVADQFAGLLPPLVLDGLPAGLTVRDVTADPAGIIVDLTARNIRLNSR